MTAADGHGETGFKVMNLRFREFSGHKQRKNQNWNTQPFIHFLVQIQNNSYEATTRNF